MGTNKIIAYNNAAPAFPQYRIVCLAAGWSNVGQVDYGNGNYLRSPKNVAFEAAADGAVRAFYNLAPIYAGSFRFSVYSASMVLKSSTSTVAIQAYDGTTHFASGSFDISVSRGDLVVPEFYNSSANTFVDAVEISFGLGGSIPAIFSKICRP